MLDKLEKLEKEYLELQSKLADPDVIANQSEYKILSRKYKSLEKAANLAMRLRDAHNALNEAEEIIKMEDDSEMIDLAKEQMAEAKVAIEELDEEAILELIPKDPNDQRDCIVEIRAGAGGDEAGIFAGELGRMYFRYAENNNLNRKIYILYSHLQDH